MLEDWRTERADRCLSPLSILVHHPAAGARCDDLCESNTREALTKIVPWFFALDHIHYSKWIPIHLRDMVSLKECHPDV